MIDAKNYKPRVGDLIYFNSGDEFEALLVLEITKMEIVRAEVTFFST